MWEQKATAGVFRVLRLLYGMRLCLCVRRWGGREEEEEEEGTRRDGQKREKGKLIEKLNHKTRVCRLPI